MSIGNENDAFRANFNGNGYTISSVPAVLFAFSRGTIRDIGIIDVDVTSRRSVGGLASDHNLGGLVGVSHGTISGSYTTGSVSGCDYVGGLAGVSHGTISGSYSTASVSGCNHVGGLVGLGDTISGSYATGNVSGKWYVGGLAGGASTISSSYSTGNVSVSEPGSLFVGGLAGSASTISGSYATGNVSGENSVGGLVGISHDTISGSYASGSVLGEFNVGGLAGPGQIISGSYATGNVSGNELVGGLAGDASTISASYSTGRVTGTGENVGGLVGRRNDNITVIGGYWDSQTSGQATSAAGEGKTTVELQSPTGYTGVYAAWHIDIDNADQDFDQSTGVDDVWDFGTSSQYPALKADINGDGVATWQEFGNQRGQTPAPTPRPTAAPALTPTAGTVGPNARPSAEVFGELVGAGLLVAVWRYDNATQSWDAYDPSAPVELNDLTHAAPKDIVWVEVTETTQFQGGTLRKGWNLISLK